MHDFCFQGLQLSGHGAVDQTVADLHGEAADEGGIHLLLHDDLLPGHFRKFGLEAVRLFLRERERGSNERFFDAHAFMSQHGVGADHFRKKVEAVAVDHDVAELQHHGLHLVCEQFLYGIFLGILRKERMIKEGFQLCVLSDGLADESEFLFCFFQAVLLESNLIDSASVFLGDDYVLIHDGARPVITTEIINICAEMVKEVKALSVMTKTIDTIKEVEHGKIVKTIDRSKLYNTQTPQAFDYNLILKAHQKFEGKNFTDDAGMLEELGETVYVIDGSYRNIKITTQSDIELAKVYLTHINY